MKHAQGQVASIFFSETAKLGLKRIDVSVCKLEEMPSVDSYAVCEGWTDAIYIWEKLETQLTKEQFTAIALHELAHVPKDRFHGMFKSLRGKIRPLLWRNWRAFNTRYYRKDAERESEAERQAIAGTSFETWKEAVVKANLLVLEEKIRKRYPEEC